MPWSDSSSSNFSWVAVVLSFLGIAAALRKWVFVSKPAVVPVVPAPSKLQQDKDEEQKKAEQVAKSERDKKIAQEQKTHDEVVQEQVTDLKKRAETLAGDLEASNTALLNIGRKIRE